MIERVVGLLEIGEVGVEPLVVLEEPADVLRARLDVRDEVGAARGEAGAVVRHALLGAALVDLLLGVELAASVSMNCSFAFAIGRLDDDDERSPAADATELVLERLEARAVAREELEEIRVELEVRVRVAPGPRSDEERDEEHDQRMAAARVDDARDGPAEASPSPGRPRPRATISSWMRSAWARASNSASTRARAARPCRSRSVAVAEVAQNCAARPFSSGGWQQRACRSPSASISATPPTSADDGDAEGHGLDDGARERIGVDARHDRDVEVAHVRPHVLPETEESARASRCRACRARSLHSAR